MKAKKKIVGMGIAVLGVGIVLLGLVSAPAYGQYHRGHMGRGAMGLLSPRLLQAVGVTDEQQEQIQEIIDAQRESSRTIRSQYRKIRAEMSNKLFAPGEVTADSFAEQVKQLNTLGDQLVQQRIAVALKIRGLLTPDQLAKAAELRVRLKELRGEMRSLYGERK